MVLRVAVCSQSAGLVLTRPSSSTPPADCLFMEAGLVAADRLYTTKRQILEELGLGGWGQGQRMDRRKIARGWLGWDGYG